MNPTRRLVISTVGTSILREYLPPDHRNLPIRLANQKELTAEDAHLVDEIVDVAQRKLPTHDIKTIRRQSAELNGLYALYDDQLNRGTNDIHILIATDTVLGRRCAGLVEGYLRHCGLNASAHVITKMSAASTADFEHGSKELMYWCNSVIPEFRSQGYTVVFNLVAAFKALQGYLNTIGMFYADQILYLFEGGDAAPVYIPRLPITINFEALNPYAVQLAMMVEGNAVIPLTELQGLSPALYDYDGEGQAVISDWGILAWGQVRDKLLGGQLLPFPRLQYEKSFVRDAASVNASERIELQRVLAKVSTILQENNGNPARLKEPGRGLRYDNYTGLHSDKGHFRLTDGVRVSCIAQNGGLLLRHFGAHDYVNDNP